MKLARIALALAAVSAGAIGQTPAPATAAAAPDLPSYYVAAGVTYGFFNGHGFASSTELAIRAGSTPLYSYTDIEQSRTVQQIATGAAYVAKVSGNWMLIALGAVGLSTASFTGGAEVAYDVGAQTSGGKRHGYLGLFARALTLSNAKTQPVYGFTIGTGF